jgi:enterochelin esterase-like enzyme
MKTRILASFIILMNVICSAQNLPKVSSGSIKHIENFKSQFIAARNVDIWMPEGYISTKKYNVVYMRDGQMLFNSTSTWNHKEWKVDETPGYFYL